MVAVLKEVEPDAVVSLLMTLPDGGVRKLSDFDSTRQLWKSMTASLLPAAQSAGVKRFVTESMIFAYGYGRNGDRQLTEDDPNSGPPPLGKAGQPFIDEWRDMERRVLESGQTTATEGIVLRYGVFHGPEVPHAQMMAEMVKRWAMPVPTGKALFSWVEIGDAASATLAALTRGRGGQIYNIVDDEPLSFRRYMNDLAATINRPKPLAVPRWLIKPFAPYAAVTFGYIQLAVSNAKAKRELNWLPRYTNHQAVFEDQYR